MIYIWKIKRLLNSVIAKYKYRDLSVSRRSIILVIIIIIIIIVIVIIILYYYYDPH